MAEKRIAEPAVEPLSLAEAATHLRLDSDFTDDNDLVAGLIQSAREDAENITRRALCEQQWLMTLDKFPGPGMNVASSNWYGPQWGISPGPLTTLQLDGVSGYEIFLTHPPLQTVDSIKYVDTSGVLQTMSASDYLVDDVSEPARIVPAYGKTWPETRNQIGAVQVRFTCGYASAEQVPAGIKAWMKLRIASLYENREETAIVRAGKIQELPYVDTLLAPYRVLRY